MAEYVRQGDIGIIYLNNPPVNALSWQTRRAVYGCLQRADEDDSIAVVLCGKRGRFSAGADISEFSNMPTAAGFPTLIELICALESSRKPLVAAIGEYALGGGLELALGCHYRIATTTTVLGFPEVKLGILPAAGGTQGFPRLIDIDAAMEWISTGKQYSAKVAKKLGVLDQIVAKDSDLISEAITFARSVACKSLADRRLSALPVKNASEAEKLAAKHLKRIHRKSHGQHSPSVCIQAVKFAAEGSYVKGLKKEKELFRMLVTSSQSMGLRYSFFAEREIKKWKVPGTEISWKTSKKMPINLGAVIGLGTMGRGIVINFLRAGVPVIVKEMNEEALESGLQTIYAMIDEMEKREVIGRKQNLMMKSAITGTQNYHDLKDVDLVIEAVYEDLNLKKKVFQCLDRACKPSTILATNTSALDIDKIASSTNRPEKVMGMHFFAPSHIMKLLENINGIKTSAETIATCMDMGKRMKKVTVLAGNCHGFIGNRMYIHYMNESDFLLEEGAYPHIVDKALTDFGFAMGRFLVGDISGNDVYYRIRHSTGLTHQQQKPGTKDTERDGLRYCAIADYLCEKRRFGTKTGKGWYDFYSPDVPEPSPEVNQMIDEYRARNFIQPRRIDDQEVIERMLYPLINEGFKILDEGFAASPMDVDMVWIHGYAWPKHTGGPMFYAHLLGLPKLLQKIQQYHEKFSDASPHWKPSKMLVRLVEKYGNPPIDKWMSCSSAAVTNVLQSNL